MPAAKGRADGRRARTAAAEEACPCGGEAFSRCCGRFFPAAEGPGAPQQAGSALELMRSRYSAYVRRDEAYLRATWHPATCPAEAILEQDKCQWLGLEIRRHASVGEQATVEFVARYKINGRASRLHETSRFVREGGRWWYLDGDFP